MIERINNNESITIDFVGDSITYGITHCRDEETYVAKFTSFFARQFAEYTVNRYDGNFEDDMGNMTSFDGPILVSVGSGKGTVDIIRNGIGGNTVKRALNRIDDFTGTLANGKRPDITFLMFGINDALKPNVERYAEPSVFKVSYKEMIDKIKASNPETAIILMEPTYNDWSVAEHAEKVRELAEEYGFPCIRLHTLWMEHYDEKAHNFGQGDWLGGGCDACHPTPLASEITAKYIFDDFIKILKENKI